MLLFTSTNLLQRALLSLLITVEVMTHLFVLRYIYSHLPSNSLDNPVMDALYKALPLINTMEGLERTVSTLAAIACLACFVPQFIRALRQCNDVLPDPSRGTRMATRPTNGDTLHDAEEDQLANIRRAWMNEVALWVALEGYWRAETLLEANGGDLGGAGFLGQSGKRFRCDSAVLRATKGARGSSSFSSSRPHTRLVDAAYASTEDLLNPAITKVTNLLDQNHNELKDSLRSLPQNSKDPTEHSKVVADLFSQHISQTKDLLQSLDSSTNNLIAEKNAVIESKTKCLIEESKNEVIKSITGQLLAVINSEVHEGFARIGERFDRMDERFVKMAEMSAKMDAETTRQWLH